MGLFSKAKKMVSSNPITKLGATAIDPLNVSGMGTSLGDLLMGKKDKGTPDSYVPLHAAQEKALGKYTGLLDTNTDSLASAAVAKQEEMVRAGAQDSERQARDLVAQRGLGNSSVGLNAILGASRDMGDKIGAVRASLPAMKYQMNVDNLNSASAGIGNILKNRIFKQGREGGGRTGGLMPLLGAGIGGLLGGPGGATAGMSAGQYVTQMG
jgi:hypothetical protein